MARTIILELTDEQEQQLLRQAEQLNLPPESVLLQAIAPTQPDAQDLYAALSCLFIQLRQARLDQEAMTQVPLTDIALTFAQFMKQSGQITNFELVNPSDAPHILLHLKPHLDQHFSLLQPTDGQSPSPQLASILKDLDNEDPNIRIKAVQALGELSRESA
jgi:ribosomal protein S8